MNRPVVDAAVGAASQSRNEQNVLSFEDAVRARPSHWFSQPQDDCCALWLPTVSVQELAGEVVIRADLQDVAKDALRVEVVARHVVISGELRLHGLLGALPACAHASFYREVELPDGALPARAVARFDAGILEVRIPSPPATLYRRKLEVLELPFAPVIEPWEDLRRA